jgi:hypothetical protein
MTTCPRCKLPQKDPRQCEYCGLEFKDDRPPTAAGGKRAGVAILVLVIIGAVAAASWYHFNRSVSGKPPAAVENQGGSPRETSDSKLKKTARELSGGAGLLNRAAEGTSRGGIIAMVFFSVVGIGYLSYGKKRQQLTMVVCGIALMGYSYFVSGTLLIVLIGVGLSVFPFVVGYLS